jgi:Glycosyl transferase family 2
MSDTIELTILMPCLNEAGTLGACIEKARLGIQRPSMWGEVIVADNGSQDSSVQIAEELGARVVHVGKKGYSNTPAFGPDLCRSYLGLLFVSPSGDGLKAVLDVPEDAAKTCGEFQGYRETRPGIDRRPDRSSLQRPGSALLFSP